MQRLLFLITLLISWGSIYAQTDYAEFEWVRRYFGYDTSAYRAKAFAIDDYGNSYVAVDDLYFQSSDSSFHHDYVVIKYNSIGKEELVLRYSPSIDSMNEVTQIALDKLGDIYVAGFSNYGGYYKTLKYSSNGNLEWVATESSGDMYGGGLLPMGLATDDSGNAYMVASTGQIYKYSSDGEKIWSIPRDERYTTSMALDRNANIYIARSGAVAKYNSNGNKQWEVSDTLEPNTILVSENGGIYVCGDKGLTKYSREGEKQWAAVFDKNFFIVYVVCMILDNIGNPVVFGVYYNGSYDQYAVIKFDTNGTKLWEAFYAGPYPGLMYLPRGPKALCTDRFNNIYITGDRYGENMTWDITVIKYSPTGEEKWVIRYNDQEQVDKLPIAVKVDTLGNIYITGFNLGNNSFPEIVTLKYKQPNFLTAVNAERINEYSFNLYQNYPNPFNPQTTIRFSIPKRSFITIRVFDLLGREIAILVNEERSAGEHKIVFNGKNLPSGVYFCQLQSGEFKQTRKFILQK